MSGSPESQWGYVLTTPARNEREALPALLAGMQAQEQRPTARILMPRSYVRLSAGRLSLSDEAQALCFLAGANSVFLGDRLLTTPNPAADVDRCPRSV